MGRAIVGTAGWSVARTATRFPQDGSSLERYAAVFSGVEINSSFYRRHRPATWQRWHDAVPESFQFAVKLPKRISHEQHLADCENLLDEFFADITPLGTKCGPLLLQLPPKLAFDETSVTKFFTALRQRCTTPVVIEPRHDSWAEPAVSELLRSFAIGRVLADPQSPALKAAAREESVLYLRLHGTPKIYYSAYAVEALDAYAAQVASAGDGSWCIFDNTASGAALTDALGVLDRLT